MVRFIWFHQHPVCVCKFVTTNYLFQIKSSFEDRVIASILGKSSDVAFRISVYEPSFYSMYFTVTLQDSKISFVLCHLGAYHMIVKRKGLMKVSRRQVKVSRRQFSCIKANMRFTMPCNCSGCWMVWGGGG